MGGMADEVAVTPPLLWQGYREPTRKDKPIRIREQGYQGM